MDQQQSREYENGLFAYRRDRTELLHKLEKHPRPDDLPDFVSDKMFDVFVEQVRFLQDHDIKFLVVIPPNVWEWTYHVGFIERLRARCRDDIPFIDFGDFGKWPELFLPPDIRYNNAHMDSKGAAVWSTVLADQFAKLINTEAPTQSNRPICAWH